MMFGGTSSEELEEGVSVAAYTWRRKEERVLTCCVEANDGKQEGEHNGKPQPHAPEEPPQSARYVGPGAGAGWLLPSTTAQLLLLGKSLVLWSLVEERQAGGNVAHVLAEEAKAIGLVGGIAVDLGTPGLRRGPGDVVRGVDSVRLDRSRGSAVGKRIAEAGTGPATASLRGWGARERHLLRVGIRVGVQDRRLVDLSLSILVSR